jgi:transcriptional activator SPT7
LDLSIPDLNRLIEEKRDLVSYTDLELLELFSTLNHRNGRSKWADHRVVGQSELYEAVGKVLNELRDYTEISASFLMPIGKRDAPDYSQIIRYPMDLGTMMKKLKRFEYVSKVQVVEDLTLICANCLIYNSRPSHLVRRRALAMQREIKKLVPLILDIVVRKRKERRG